LLTFGYVFVFVPSSVDLRPEDLGPSRPSTLCQPTFFFFATIKMLKLSLSNVLSVSKKDRKQEMKTVAFHPNEPTAFIVVDNEVYGTPLFAFLKYIKGINVNKTLVSDIISGSVTAKLRAIPGEIVDVCASAAEPLVAVLILDKEVCILDSCKVNVSAHLR